MTGQRPTLAVPTGQRLTLAVPTGRRLTLAVPSLAFGGAERVVAEDGQPLGRAGRGGDRHHAFGAIRATPIRSTTASREFRSTRWANRAARSRPSPITCTACASCGVRSPARQPETVISFTDRMNVLTLLACRPLRVDTVISERIDPSRYEIGRAWSWLRRRVYPIARALVVQTERVRGQMVGVMRGRPIYVIPNAVVPNASSATPPNLPGQTGRRMARTIPRASAGSSPSVGLPRRKASTCSIDAFSRIADRHPQWSLKILGEGPARPSLERLIDAKRLGGRVVLAGWESDPAAVLRRCDLFVLSSRFEGFPNALLEAMACGLPSSQLRLPIRAGRNYPRRNRRPPGATRRRRRPGKHNRSRSSPMSRFAIGWARKRSMLSSVSASSVTSPIGTPCCAATLRNPRANSERGSWDELAADRTVLKPLSKVAA